MTIKEYISQRLQAFQLADADFMNLELEGISVDEDYTIDNQEEVNKSLIGALESLLFAPRLKSINEQGFSLQWEYEHLGKFYLWLCRRYGVKPSDDVLALLGISTIIDRTNIW